ncbi:hypothetical protein [Lacticaseibacillus yichunensis]|uniref:Uncharacterized protein n=1 Tax=Lacticaseibacillus yichunensis TaxID=2486015 RepID=A0ABW4CR12_9LACO|nr:hypothetical protein [Lacticaseibacillus yichunensis]
MTLSRITLGVFLVAGTVFLVSLITWLIVMIANREPKWPRRVTIGSAAVAILALAVNALL